MTGAAGSRCKALSKRPSAPIPWFTPSCLPINTKTATDSVAPAVAGHTSASPAAAIPVGDGRAAAEEEGAAADEVPKNLAWTERKSWIRFQGKQAAVPTRFPKSTGLTQFKT